MAMAGQFRIYVICCFFFSSRRRHTRCSRDWSSDVCSSDLAYTFDHIAEIINHFTDALGLSRYTLYMQDYGGPVGFRMILAHPERVEALIVQDAVAHNTGLGENWKTRRAYWADRAAYESALRTNLLSLETTRSRHVGNDPDLQRHDRR